MLFIGSSNQTKYGIGALLKWKKEELSNVYYDPDAGWVVVDTAGEKFTCYQVITVESPWLETTELSTALRVWASIS